MKSTVAVAALALAVSGVLAQDMTINTPTSLVQCLPALLTWNGGKPPYFLSVVPGGQAGAAALVDLGQQGSTSLTWTVNVAQGTSVGLELRDSTGLVAQSAPVTIQNSSNNTCVGQTAQTASASGGAGQTTGSGSGSTAGTTGGSSTNTGGASSPSQTKPTTSGSGSPSNSASGSSATQPNSAPKTQVGVVGAVGAAVLALVL